MVDIDHENGWVTRYGHNELLLVKFGDTVRKGQPVAIYGGIDGSSTGTHLHFEMHYQGKAVNPLDYLPKLTALKITSR
jgi:murein DD-endopeptidase MepM/ murein hydrolase activator NlpD